jgi:cytochrome b561
MKTMLPSAPDTMHRYTAIAVLAHWLSAGAIAVMLALGWTMTALEDTPGSDVWFGWHRSLGTVLALLIVLRLLWRLGHRPTEPDRLAPRLERLAATAMHCLLYLMMFVMPITGLAGSWLSEDGLGIFGQVAPQPLGVHKLLSESLFNLHAVSAWVLIMLASLHVLAAFKHRLIEAKTLSGKSSSSHSKVAASHQSHAARELGAYPRRRFD